MGGSLHSSFGIRIIRKSSMCALSGKGRSRCSPRTCFDRWTMVQVATFKLVSQGDTQRKPNTRGIDKDSKKTSAKNSLESPTEFG